MGVQVGASYDGFGRVPLQALKMDENLLRSQFQNGDFVIEFAHDTPSAVDPALNVKRGTLFPWLFAVSTALLVMKTLHSSSRATALRLAMRSSPPRAPVLELARICIGSLTRSQACCTRKFWGRLCATLRAVVRVKDHQPRTLKTGDTPCAGEMTWARPASPASPWLSSCHAPKAVARSLALPRVIAYEGVRV